ncbi:GNAT family N-acetyltransferase [Sporobolomyces koalae]|uniref:GNAT family N-acetyltransferase n=1 Tax=Sporobolomyces koalae TaxID=500713 RepID=UPI003170950A
MPFTNHCAVETSIETREYHLTTPLSSYNLNWGYGDRIPPWLETPGGVRLVPLIPSIHAERLLQLFSRYPESYVYLPYGPFETLAEFLTKLELARRDSNTLLFAVYDLSLDLPHKFDRSETEDFSTDREESEGGQGLRSERLAGIVGLKESQVHNRMTEVGHVHIAPLFQRTHVAQHAISLLLHYCLDSPTESSPHNLGLRRVQWFANPDNEPSVTAALKLGFQLEARFMLWERTLPPNRGKISLDLPQFLAQDPARLEREEHEFGRGRHSSLLSLDWVRWNEHGGRQFVIDLIERRPVVRRAWKEPS